MLDRQTYIIDTNILVDYPDLIPAGDNVAALEKPTVDFTDAHLVIPTAVIRELSSFKKEPNERGKAARVVLKRLRNLVEDHEPWLAKSYNLDAPIRVGETYYSILPVHKSFKKCLPFSPSDEDMDGQIILAAIAAEFLAQSLPVDGRSDSKEFTRWLPCGRVTLLTNDNGLAIRANQRGVVTSRYGYKLPAPYTGRRDVTVPIDVIDYFCTNQGIELDIWRLMVPADENHKMVANEFIIMHPEDPDDDYVCTPNLFFQYIGRYDVDEGAIVPLRYALEYPGAIQNNGQAIYAEALMNPKFSAVICTGPAGSGKTYMSTIYGYNACRTGEYIGVTVVPCGVEDNLGSLPGGLNSKMDLEVQPIKNALRNYLLKNDRVFRSELEKIHAHGADMPKSKSVFQLEAPESEGVAERRSINQKLQDFIDEVWDGWFKNIPISRARGRDFSYEVAIYDEFQDQNPSQADTLIKRLGAEGKIIITGDVYQVHAPFLDAENNGLVYASQLLYDTPMVAQVCFTEDEVIRHPLVRVVTERQKAERKAAKNML